MVKESNYTRWRELAQKIDRFSGRMHWKAKKESKLYDFQQVEMVTNQLKLLLRGRLTQTASSIRCWTLCATS